jgi:hypothetical protein
MRWYSLLNPLGGLVLIALLIRKQHGKDPGDGPLRHLRHLRILKTLFICLAVTLILSNTPSSRP